MRHLLLIALILFAAVPVGAAPDRDLSGGFVAPPIQDGVPALAVLVATTTRAEAERFAIAIAVPLSLDVLQVDSPAGTICVSDPPGFVSCYGAIDAGEPITLTLTLQLNRCSTDTALALPASFYIRDTFVSLDRTFSAPIATSCTIHLPIMSRGTFAQ